MSLTIISAKDPAWLDAEHTAINLDVQFEHLESIVQFTASVSDTEPHGRVIYARAAAGEFGEVTEYIPPTELEIAARDNPPLRRQQMKQAAEQATHWDMMGAPEQAAAWRNYYRELYALEQAPGWPLAPQWPTAPELAA